MKMRLNFVSNSSSSSFIITGDIPVEDEYITLRIKKSHIFDDIITNKEELDKFYKGRYSWSGCETPLLEMLKNEEVLDDYNEHLARIEAGGIVAFADAEYGQEDMLQTLCKGAGLDIKSEW